MHVMWAISESSKFKSLWLLTLVHARTRASKHVCVQECVFVIMLLLKLVFLKAPVQVYVSSIYDYVRMPPST
jgi:hypothetical protein